jgi:hypothetical protein
MKRRLPAMQENFFLKTADLNPLTGLIITYPVSAMQMYSMQLQGLQVSRVSD